MQPGGPLAFVKFFTIGFPASAFNALPIEERLFVVRVANGMNDLQLARS